MIFSKFFKAKWQNKDSNVRITAINDELLLDNPEHKRIITTLAQEDDSEMVRRAALVKLSEYDFWLEQSQSNSNKKIREFLLKQINLVLLGEHKSIVISKDKKLDYIKSASSIFGLEAWLNVEADSEIVIALYEKINKPQLLMSVFSQKQTADVQRYLLDGINDKDILDKLIKKACNDGVTQQIATKIAKIEHLLEQPKIVAKKAQLNLSKFLALTDVADYGVMDAKKSDLLAEWTTLAAEFDCLAEQERDVFETKHQNISEQLEKIFAPKAEAYKQQLIADKLKKEQNAAREIFETETTALNQNLSTSIFEFAEVDEDAFSAKINTLYEQVQNSPLNDYEKKHFSSLLADIEYKLTQLPVIAQSVSEATYHISKISQLALPTNSEELNERQPIFKEWVAKWREIEDKASGVLPESIVNAFKEISAHWKKGLAPLIAEQKAQLTQTQKKMSELNRLISSGKYNIAFGVFKRVEKLFNQLSDAQKAKAQKEFDNVSAKIADLSDWEHYIATPRKQKLLEEIKALVETPLDNPNDQATKVKEYRKVWNSLGHADDEVERTLNAEFNECCEKAFAPCRLFYKEQEKIREQHLVVRQALLENVKTFASSYNQEPVNWKDVDTQLNQFQQQWQNAGEVERSVYKTIQAEFNNAIRPVKAAIKSYQDNNALLKQELINQAQQASESDDVFAAIQTVKSLQAKWKDIGYSGAKNENKLWKAFRSHNDELFKKRDEVAKSNKAEQQAQFTELSEHLNTLNTKLDTLNTIAELSAMKPEYDALLNNVLAIKPVNKSLVKNIEKALSSIDSDINNLKTNKEKQNWQSIFVLLENIAAKTISVDELQSNEAFAHISPSWQKRLVDVMKSEAQADRLEKTLELEIFAGQESPAEYKDQRMKVQVKLMQEQMLSGNAVNLQDNFISWLQQGSLDEGDLALIERIKPIYC